MVRLGRFVPLVGVLGVLSVVFFFVYIAQVPGTPSLAAYNNAAGDAIDRTHEPCPPCTCNGATNGVHGETDTGGGGKGARSSGALGSATTSLYHSRGVTFEYPLGAHGIDWSEAQVVEPPPPPRLFTLAIGQSAPLPLGYCLALLAATHYGVDIAAQHSLSPLPRVYSMSHRYRGLFYKLEEIENVMEDFEPLDFVVFFDGSDAIANRDLAGLYDAFLSCDANVVISVERQCAPDRRFCAFQKKLAQEAGVEHLKDRWLNSGLIVGYAGAIRSLMGMTLALGRAEEAAGLMKDYTAKLGEDQYWLQESLELSHTHLRVRLDYRQLFAYTEIHSVPGDRTQHTEEGPDVRVLINDNVRPFFHHYNGDATKALLLADAAAMRLFQSTPPRELLQAHDSVSGLTLEQICCPQTSPGPTTLNHTIDVCPATHAGVAYSYLARSLFARPVPDPSVLGAVASPDADPLTWRCDVNLALAPTDRRVLLNAGLPTSLDASLARVLERSGRIVGSFDTGRWIPEAGATTEQVHDVACALLNAKWSKGRRFTFSGAPWFLLYREFYHTFPGARFVLMIQSPDEWRYNDEWRFNDGWDAFLYGDACADVASAACRTSRALTYMLHAQQVIEFFNSVDPSALLVLDADAIDGSSWEQVTRFVQSPPV
eukprot:TRINITY_DN5003_c0_g1_i1.p1 TRINITY_DN5003_c0_g1~~TRINITY_DN5003_c0_g1_i1.p1  ORF type:complete len:655 (-),score=142.30 TRINITY_DN5003_c0_g1_i1:88-2052(-)